MTGYILFDWFALSISLVNTILLLWLGLTMLLNAEYRTWGVWLTGGAALMGSAFFAAHTAILASVTAFIGWSLNFWWRLGWTPLIAVPFIWYIFALWYSGFWQARRRSSEIPNSEFRIRTPHSALRTPHSFLFWITGGLLLILVGMFLFTTLLPSFTEVALFEFSSAWTVRGVPLLLVIFPLYVFLCTSLALDAFRRPIPAPNRYSDDARVRARPWLVAATGLLLAISLLVAGLVAWVFVVARNGIWYQEGFYTPEHSRLLEPGPAQWVVAEFDLLIAALVTLTIYLIGQAMVSYEVLSGRALPRGDLRRHWRNIILLAAGYSLSVSTTLVLNLPSVYGVILASGLLAVFYALFNWRNFRRNEEMMRRLRAFAGSQHMVEQVLEPGEESSNTEAQIDTHSPFQTLCMDVLKTHFAALLPLGPMAPLAGTPLAFPEESAIPSINEEIVNRLAAQSAARVSILPLDIEGQPILHAVPLWGVRGLIGVLILGERRDGGLYTEEEIEVARATGERLIDTQASAEVTRRLLTLQRQRLAESQVLDRQTRRILHDEVLPELHTAIIALAAEDSQSAISNPQSAIPTQLISVHRRISALLRSSPVQSTVKLERGLLAGLHELVDLEMRGLFDQVKWQIDESALDATTHLSPLATEVVYYAVRESLRNAARHGRGTDSTRSLTLTIEIADKDGLEIIIADDGIGLQTDPNHTNGTGQGLALHTTLLAMLGGTLTVDSQFNQGTCVVIRLDAG